MTESTTAQAVQEAEASVAADHLTARLDIIQTATGMAEKDPALAAEGMTDAELAEYVALIQDIRHRLGLVERDLTVALGQRLGKAVGNLGDGRQFKLERSTDRKEWNHDDWKRDVRRTLAQAAVERFVPADAEPGVMVDTTTGEQVGLTYVAHTILAAAQEVHGAQSPKTTALKALGLYASDYCTSTPAGWRFTALRPTTTQEDATDA